MSFRSHNRMPRIMDTVIETKGATWNSSTAKVAREDAERVLEALVAECGIEATIRALNKQGIEGGAYGYLLKPLLDESLRRRRLADEWAAGSEHE